MGLPNPTHIAVSELIYKSNAYLVTLIKRKCYHIGMEVVGLDGETLKGNWQEELDASHKIDLKRDFKFYYSCAEDLYIELLRDQSYDEEIVLEITKILVELDNR